MLAEKLLNLAGGADSISVFRAISFLITVTSPLIPLQRLLVLSLVVEYSGHEVDRVEGNDVVLSQDLLMAIEGS